MATPTPEPVRTKSPKGATCAAQFRDDSWHWRVCREPAKVTADGTHYCGAHDPAKQRAKHERLLAESRQRIADARRADAIQAAERAVIDAAREWTRAPKYRYERAGQVLNQAVLSLMALELAP